jgi:hypothetical protein
MVAIPSDHDEDLLSALSGMFEDGDELFPVPTTTTTTRSVDARPETPRAETPPLHRPCLFSLIPVIAGATPLPSLGRKRPRSDTVDEATESESESDPDSRGSGRKRRRSRCEWITGPLSLEVHHAIFLALHTLAQQRPASRPVEGRSKYIYNTNPALFSRFGVTEQRAAVIGNHLRDIKRGNSKDPTGVLTAALLEVLYPSA